MKSAFLLFFILLGYATIARGQGDPATNLKGQAASGLGNSASTIVVPNNQSTKLNAYQAILETGNKNLLVNPGFEHATVGTGWSTSVTGTAVATIVPETTSPIFGKKSATLTCDSGASGGTCTFYQDAPTAYRLDGLVSIYLKVDFPGSSAYKVFARNDGANTSAEIEIESDEAQLVKLPYPTGVTSTGIAIVVQPPPTAVFETIADEAFVGVQDVKQDQQACNSIECTTEFTAEISASTVLVNSTYDFLTSCSYASSIISCNVAPSAFTQRPNCTATSIDNDTTVRYAASSTTSVLSFVTEDASTNGYAQRGIMIACQRQGTDYTKAIEIRNRSVVATKADFFSTDTNTLTFKPTTAIVAADPVGTFNTYSYAINSNTRTICGGSGPAQYTNVGGQQDIKNNGFLIYTRAYNAASTCGNPARVEIKIAPAGTSLPTLSREIYKSAGKSVSGSVDYSVVSTGEAGLTLKNYNESTGIITLDSGWSLLGASNTSRNFAFSDLTTQTSGYLVINAQKAKTSAVMDLAEFDYVYVDAAGNAGQTITASTTNIPFIEIEDNTNSWNGSQFTVPTDGIYMFSGSTFTSSSVAGRVILYINGAISKTMRDSFTDTSHKFELVKKLTKGQTVTLRSDVGWTLSNQPAYHHLTITRIPGQFR